MVQAWKCCDCFTVLPSREVYQGGRCRGCAERREPAVCHACQGFGSQWGPGRDALGQTVMRLLMCEECLGSGVVERRAG